MQFNSKQRALQRVTAIFRLHDTVPRAQAHTEKGTEKGMRHTPAGPVAGGRRHHPHMAPRAGLTLMVCQKPARNNCFPLSNNFLYLLSPVAGPLAFLPPIKVQTGQAKLLVPDLTTGHWPLGLVCFLRNSKLS